jgi:protein gp37
MFREYVRLNRIGVNGYDLTPDQIQMMPERLDNPIHWRKPKLVFVNSMSDTFHSSVPDEYIDRIFQAMLDAPQHIFQVLTKRPNRVSRWWERGSFSEWPENIWLGTSVESEQYLPRIDRITGIAPVTFVSAEPLIGPLPGLLQYIQDGKVQWLIVGGESGPKARPMEQSWVRDIRDICTGADVPFFMKQWGGKRPKSNGRELDGKEWNEMPVKLAVA